MTEDGSHGDTADQTERAARRPEPPAKSVAASPGVRSEAEPTTAAPEPRPHAPSAGGLDVLTIRRAWPQLLEKLLERRQMILRANLESVTASSYDGDVLELAFPPGKKFAVQKVQSKEEELRGIMSELFGVAPKIRCVSREAGAGGPVLEEEPPMSHEDAVERIKRELGAVEEIGESS